VSLFTYDFQDAWANGADIAPEYLYFLAFKDEPDLQEKFKKWGYVTA